MASRSRNGSILANRQFAAQLSLLGMFPSPSETCGWFGSSRTAAPGPLADSRVPKTTTDIADIQYRFESPPARCTGCPTCQQAVKTELLPVVSREAMGLEENIIFIKSQLDLYRAMLGSASDSLDLIKVRYQSLREEIQEQRSKIRSLKRDLLRPTTSPARSELEEIVRLEARLERWQAQQEKVDGAVDGLRAIAREWARARAELKDLGPGDLTASDQSKVNAFQNTIQSLLARFRFQSFRASDITLSPDDFRPQVVTEDEDGERVVKDIGFEASASDGIRLKCE